MCLLILFAEVLQDPAVQAKLSDTKAAAEVKALEQFYQILQVEPARAYYGKNHVVKAAESQAIETLLISDNLFRYVDSMVHFHNLIETLIKIYSYVEILAATMLTLARNT